MSDSDPRHSFPKCKNCGCMAICHTLVWFYGGYQLNGCFVCGRKSCPKYTDKPLVPRLVPKVHRRKIAAALEGK